MPFECLHDSPPYRVDFLDGAGEDLVIAFSSIGHDATRPSTPEFVATATGRGTPDHPRRALFVMDADRSWTNDPGFAPALRTALEQVTARRPVRLIAAVGLSMGAFSALAATQVLKIDTVLALGPQYAVAPGVVPGETRWSDWTDRITEYRWPTAPIPPATCWTILCHGARDDLAQAMPFPRAAHIDHLIFPELGHSELAPHLKARGGLSGMMEAALAGDRRRLLRIASAAGAVRREKFSP
ncbi:hypothetical protein [Thioclava pacifica]|uniref:AB hydrolase-1 domain-containing protein n=1 Tax=Thioclava pacifica DSM 10166 TaxID=1353537 RepID=A0A074J6N1_9RHOB|nr:hypothetical protein [Thioclava pacifica]KEO51268.1 hypothetical protein TP2_12805 [Thioclava pacifica DSM 10166]